VKTLVVCEEDPSYAAALSHLLYVGITTLAKSKSQFKNLEVRVVGKVDGWSPFCMDFYGECSYYSEFDAAQDGQKVLSVVAYSSCPTDDLRLAGLENHVEKVLSLPLLESVIALNEIKLDQIDGAQISKAMVHADEVKTHYQSFDSMEEEQVFFADCVYWILKVLERVMLAV